VFQVADGVKRDIDPLQEFGLAQPQALPDPTRKLGCVLHGLGFIGGLLCCDLFLGGDIHTSCIYPSNGQ
jgi:hypothetical protein